MQACGRRKLCIPHSAISVISLPLLLYGHILHLSEEEGRKYVFLCGWEKRLGAKEKANISAHVWWSLLSSSPPISGLLPSPGRENSDCLPTMSLRLSLDRKKHLHLS